MRSHLAAHDRHPPGARGDHRRERPRLRQVGALNKHQRSPLRKAATALSQTHRVFERAIAALLMGERGPFEPRSLRGPGRPRWRRRSGTGGPGSFGRSTREGRTKRPWRQRTAKRENRAVACNTFEEESGRENDHAVAIQLPVMMNTQPHWKAQLY